MEYYKFHDTIENQEVVNNKRLEFERNKILNIDDFLSQESVDKIYNFLDNMHEDWWYSYFNFQNEKNPENKPISFRNFPENNENNNLHHQMTLDTFSKNMFSYSFNRTYQDHYSTCSCQLCNFICFLKSPLFISKISDLTGYNLTMINEIFASKYVSGNFLSPHHDLNKGKIGFTFYLTPNWSAQYGGILHILSDDYKDIVRSYVPKNNCAVLFDIPSQSGIPHFVSHVAPGITKKRLAITCWFE
jgi:Rps23 Pro-64 3,4-dihydroxylase Tpa1-like proline 4-hydroxylase